MRYNDCICFAYFALTFSTAWQTWLPSGHTTKHPPHIALANISGSSRAQNVQLKVSFGIHVEFIWYHFRTTFGIISSMIQHFNIWKNVRLPSCTLPNVQCLQRESNAGRMVSQSLHLEHLRTSTSRPRLRSLGGKACGSHTFPHQIPRSHQANQQQNRWPKRRKWSSCSTAWHIWHIHGAKLAHGTGWYWLCCEMHQQIDKTNRTNRTNTPKIPKDPQTTPLLSCPRFFPACSMTWQQHNTKISRLAGQLKWHHRLQEWHAKRIKKDQKGEKVMKRSCSFSERILEQNEQRV